MSDFKTRLTEEQAELAIKCDKLEIFIMGDAFKKVAPIQQSLLKVQLRAMQAYGECLFERLGTL